MGSQNSGEGGSHNPFGVKIISQSSPILENTQFKIQNSIKFRIQEIDKQGDSINVRAGSIKKKEDVSLFGIRLLCVSVLFYSHTMLCCYMRISLSP